MTDDPQGGGVTPKEASVCWRGDLAIALLSKPASVEIWQPNEERKVRLSVLEVEGEVRGQDGLFQQLHEVAVLCGRQVAEDVMTLWRHIARKKRITKYTAQLHTQSAQNKDRV